MIRSPCEFTSVRFITAPLCHPQNVNGNSRQHAETHGNVNRKIETLRIKSKCMKSKTPKEK